MKITEGVYALDAGTTRCFLIVDRQMVLVDAGSSFAAGTVIRGLAGMGITPKDLKHIVITHSDVEQVGGLGALWQWSGAKVWAHSAEIPYIAGKEPRPGRSKYAPLLARPPLCDLRPYEPGKMVGPVQIIETPGHTPGHVSVLYQKTLFVGDLVENKGGLGLGPKKKNWDTGKLLESIAGLSTLDYEWVCMSRGAAYQGRIEWLAEEARP